MLSMAALTVSVFVSISNKEVLNKTVSVKIELIDCNTLQSVLFKVNNVRRVCLSSLDMEQ